MDYFKKLGLKEAYLKPTTCPMIGFNGVLSQPTGVVSLPIIEGSVTEVTKFLVITVTSLYNLIMGQTWIHKIKVTQSTFHQAFRFPTANAVDEILGDQSDLKNCYSTAISTKMAQVQNIEVEDRPVLEDVGSDLRSKVIEDLEQISAEQEEPQLHVLIGTSLAPEKKKGLVQLLKRNIEVFVWTPYEMSSINLKVDHVLVEYQP